MLLPLVAAIAAMGQDVGSKTCSGCHAQIYRAYAGASMSQSSGKVGAGAFRESLDRSSDQEIPAQLNYVGRAQIFSEVKDSLTDRSQDGLNPLFGRLLTREANPQPSRSSGFGSSEDRGSKVSHFVSCVLFRQLPRCHWRNRAH